MEVKKYTSPATVSRRRFLFQALAGAAGLRAMALADGKATAPGLPRDGFLPDELRAMEATAAAFMKKHQVPGLSVAIARKGRLVYADGYSETRHPPDHDNGFSGLPRLRQRLVREQV
jgi:hypothetical protein